MEAELRAALEQIVATRNTRVRCRRHGGDAFDESDPDACVCYLKLDAEKRMRDLAIAALTVHRPVREGDALPFEAVEAAGRSLHRSDSRKRPASARAWEQLGRAARNRYLGNAAYALRAARPHLHRGRS